MPRYWRREEAGIGVMRRRDVMAGLLSAVLVAGPGAAEPLDDIVASLRAEGFEVRQVTRTWLGRIRVEAVNDRYQREIVFDRVTGEVMRDYLSRRRVERPASDGRSGTSSGTSGGRDSGSSSGSGGDDDADDDGDDGGGRGGRGGADDEDDDDHGGGNSGSGSNSGSGGSGGSGSNSGHGGGGHGGGGDDDGDDD